MKPEEQRITLAEWAGWKWFQKGAKEHDVYWQSPEGRPNHLPDITDLNVLHEYEKRLTGREALRYAEELNAATRCFKHITPVIMCMATAAQRAEALLRTIGKWKEDK